MQASGFNGREVVAVFQTVLELHQLFQLMQPEGEFLPLYKQKWRPNTKALPHTKSTKVSRKVFWLLLESSCFHQCNPWIKIFRHTFNHTRKSLISQHNTSKFAIFLLIFIASLSKQRCSLLGHVADLSGGAAARVVAGGQHMVSADSAGAGQHRSDVIVKTDLGTNAKCWVMNKRSLGWGVFFWLTYIGTSIQSWLQFT